VAYRRLPSCAPYHARANGESYRCVSSCPPALYRGRALIVTFLLSWSGPVISATGAGWTRTLTSHVDAHEAVSHRYWKLRSPNTACRLIGDTIHELTVAVPC